MESVKNVWSRIKSMYIDSSVSVRVKGVENEWFRIDSGVREGCIMSHWLFIVYMDVMMKDGRKWILPVFFYAHDLVLCGSWKRA